MVLSVRLVVTEHTFMARYGVKMCLFVADVVADHLRVMMVVVVFSTTIAIVNH